MASRPTNIRFLNHFISMHIKPQLNSCICAAVFLAAGWPGRSATAPTRRIEFRVLTSFGERLPFTVEYLLDPYGRKDFADKCSKSACPNIPPGVYEYGLILQVNARRLRGRVAVFDHDKFLVVDVGPSAGTPGDRGSVTTKGHLQHTDTKNNVWVSIRSMYSESQQFQQVDRSGVFWIEGLIEGKFLVSVFNDDKYLGTRSIDLPASSTIEIDIAKLTP
jgi:hypothetical protein